MKNYINELNELRIHELRDLARKMGVSSPTTLKKEEIISEIMEILSGSKAPASKVSKQGRPARNQDKTLSITDVFEDTKEIKKEEVKPKGCVEYNIRPRFDDMITLRQPSAKYTTESLPEFDVEGYLFVKRAFGYVRAEGFFPSDNDYLVPINYIRNKHLKQGQYLKGKIFPRQEGEFPMMHSIEFEKSGLFDFEEAKTRTLSKNINFGKLTVKSAKLGGRYMYVKQDKQELYDFAGQMANELAKTGEYSVKYLCLNALMEFVPEMEQDIEQFIVTFEKDPEAITQAVELFIDKCKREVENGKKVIIVAQNFMELIKYYQVASRETAIFAEINYETLVKIKAVLCSSKNIDDNSNLTLLVCENGMYSKMVEECITFELMPLFHNVFK